MRSIICLSIMASFGLQSHAQAGIPGWYESDDGPRIILPSARGGYRLAAPDGAQFDWLPPSDNASHEWRDRERRRDASIVFEREQDAVTGYTWTVNGKTGHATRGEEQPYRVEEIEFANGDVTFSGNLILPEGDGPFPAAVFVHGSGTNDRDNAWLFRFADFFARRNVASVIPDKRGGGKSGGDWREVGLEDYARDSLAAVEALRARSDIGSVGLFGNSQGGQIVPIAGVFDPSLAFVVDISGSLVTLGEQVRHEVAQDLQNDGATEEELAALDELFTLSHAYIRTGEGWDAYRSRLDEIRKGPAKRAAFGFVSKPDNWYWAWWRKVIDVDPIGHWSALTVPALIVYGNDDEQDNVPVSRSAQRYENELKDRPNITLRVFEDTGHGLMDKKNGGLRKDFLEYLWDWLQPHLEQ